MITKWFTGLLCGAALVGVTLSAVPAAAEQAPDKNGPGVARVSILEGSAVVQRGDDNSQVAATVNAPLLPGDYISTGDTSRAELQFDGYTAVRLGHGVQARITSNDPTNRGLQLADGTVEVGIVHSARPFTVDTPSISMRAQEAGDYRVSISKDGSSWVTARRGVADIVTPSHTYQLESGKTLVARGSASDPSITYTSEVVGDSFDDFNANRDQTMIAALNASPNVSPDIAGYDNLDAYGQWQDVAGYGQAWVPNQSPDWAPYQNGSWTWEGGYGWTWVAAEPWGWAPYHYGRWFYADGYGWAWYPPPYTAYAAPPVWQPALVGFFGLGLNFGGPGWGVSLGFGDGGYGYGDYGYGGFGYPGIAWYPLAPYVPYYPWYPGWAWTGYGWGWGHPHWGTRVVNITNINNYYGNFGHHGLTGTLHGNFTHGNFAHNITIDPRNIARMGTIHGALPVTPSRENLRFGGGTLRAPVTLSKRFESPRFASNRALASRPTFAEQQRAVSQAIRGEMGRQNAPVTRESQGMRANGNAPVSRESGALRGNNAPSTSWQRFNDSRGQGRDGSLAGESGSRGTNFRGPAPSRGPSASRQPATFRTDRAPSDSWGRFAQTRGNVTPGYAHNDSYGRESSSRGSSYGSYSRGNASPSYSRGSAYGSDSRGSSYGSYSRGNAYPSYSRGNSYGSYSRGNAYPSYSHGGGGSYSRGNASPSYSHGNVNGSSRGPGGSAPHSSGGGGGHGRDRRPPQ